MQKSANHPLNLEIQYPRLKCQVSFYSDAIVLSQNSLSYRLSCHNQNQAGLQKLFLMMDGSHHVQELKQQLASSETFEALAQQLAAQGLIEDAKHKTPDFRQNSILKWEELFAGRLSKKLEQQPLQFLAASPPVNVIYGFALEHYHLLTQSSNFYGPLLHLQQSSKIRKFLNRYYCKVNEQDELLFQGLQGLGIHRDDLLTTLQLPETIALCNALIFWANSDPLFCLSVLGIWEVQQIQTWEFYLKSLDPSQSDSLFLAAMQQFVQLKRQAQPERLKHLIISELSPFEETILEKFQRQIHLFIELNANFYTAISTAYKYSTSLLRPLTAI